MPLVPIHFEGKSVPMTAITPVPRKRRWLAKIILFIFKHLPLGFVQKLAFIHFARWILIPAEKLPRLHKDQPKEDWPYDLYLFTTNFNGSWDQYIDAFGRIKVVSKGLNMLWYTSAGFPGPWPMRLFKRYVHYFEYPVELYYNAYPGAAVRDVDTALKLQPHLDTFLAETSEPLDDKAFREKYEAFLIKAAPYLGSIGTDPEHPTLTYRAAPMELGQ